MAFENDPYAQVAVGKLKLKGDGGIKKKKKKKDKLLKEVTRVIENNSEKPGDTHQNKVTKTNAELAFLKQQEKMVSLSNVKYKILYIFYYYFIFIIFFSKLKEF